MDTTPPEPDEDKPDAARNRLDKLVAERFGLSRRAATEAVRTGRVDVDGARCDEPGLLVAPGAAVTFDPNRPKARRVVGRDAVTVLFEDRHALIVVKPAGLPTLPSAAGEPDTLRGRVERFLAIRHGAASYLGIIHRLDTDTSGAVAMARSPEALAAFQELFRRHAIERRYLAVVEGVVGPTEGTIDRAVITDEGPARRRLAREGEPGRAAVTHFRVLERFGRIATLVACWLETGRTHQIRLHLSGLGHPVLGDRVYRPRGGKRCRVSFPRQALHAQTLGFTHPFTGAEVRAEAPLPPDLDRLLVDLRNRYGSASHRPGTNSAGPNPSFGY
jgi:23S rRNA pseudouridine1911/1915/1917 synthase